MPIILEHIDKIARDKQRDVLFVAFCDGEEYKNDLTKYFDYTYEIDSNRIALMDFMDEHDISYKMCGPLASEYGRESYRGQIYIDVPMDETNDKYQKLCAYLEHEDGTPKNPDVSFYVLSLEIAMKNAHHDEPGFWDKWAEDF